MNIEDMQRRLQQLLDEVKPLAVKSKNGDLTDEEDTRFNELVEQINAIRADIDKAEQRAAKADDVLGTIDELSQSRGRLSAILPGTGAQRTSGDDERHFRNVGHLFAESEARRAFAAQPRGNSERVVYGSTYHADPTAPAIDQRALVSLPAWSDYTHVANRLPGITAADPFPLRMRDVLQNGRTDSPSIEFVVKKTSVHGATGAVESDTVGNAVAKSESTYELEVLSTTVKTIAHWIPVTRQMLQDAAQVESFIEAELLYGLRQEEDDQIVNGAGGADLTGILATTGVQDLDATYWAGAPLPFDANPLDALRRAIKQVQIVGGSNASFIGAHPDDVEEWETIKDLNGNYLLKGGGPDNGGVTRLWGRPVVPTLTVAAGAPLVGDGRRAIVLDKMDGQIFVSDSHADFFTKNLFAILAESRLALAVTLPAAFVSVDIAAAMSLLNTEP